MVRKLVMYITANNYFGDLMFCEGAAHYSVLGHGATSLGRGLPNDKRHLTDDRNPHKNTCPYIYLMYITDKIVSNGLASPQEVYILCSGSIIVLYMYHFQTKFGLAQTRICI